MKSQHPEPTIVIDTREQWPLRFDDCPSVRGTLTTGDYSILGHEQEFCVERKSLADLLGTLTRGRARFERELQRMAGGGVYADGKNKGEGYAFRRVLVESPYSTVDVSADDYFPMSLARPKSIIASVATFEVRYGVPFVFASSRFEAARRITIWARYFLRELEKHSQLC